MNEEALEYVYNDYVQSGYDGSVEDFTSLLSSNNEALDLVFNDFAESGYDGSVEDFSIMLGIDKSPKKESQVKIDSRINNVNKVYQEQVDKINAGNWDDDEKVELTKRVSAARDKQLSKLEKEKDIDLYADELIEINKSVPENLNELVSDLEYEDYEDYIDAAEQKLNIENPNVEYSQEDIERKASELYALKKYRAEQTEQALEDFESEYGIDRTKSIGSMLDVVMDFGVTGVIDTYFDAAKDIYDDHSKGKLDDVAEQWKAKKWDLVPELYERYFGTEQQKEYRKSREELHEALTIKNEKLDQKYRDDVAELTVLKNKADKDYIEFEKLQKRLKQEDSTITPEDYNRYLVLYDEIQNDKTLFNKKLEILNNSTIPSDDFETIKNLTLKTYDNLDRIDNLVSASVGRLVASTATLGNKVGLPELIKWTGIDIESEEGLNKIFGEDVDGAMGVIKDAVGVLGNINKSKNEVIDAAYDLSDSITDLNSPSMEWKNIDSVEDFAYWGGDMLAGQVVNTGLIIAFPPVGLALLAAQAAGDKMREMDIAMEGVKGEDGEFIIEPEEYNAAQYFGSAALYGGIEYVTERVSFGLLKGMLGNVSKAFKLTGRSAMPSPNITLKNLSNGKAWAKFGTDIVKGIGKEGAAEGIVAITNNLTDQYVLGDKNAYWLNNVSESVVSGMLMGKVYSVPNVAVPIMHSFSSEGELAKANKRNAELLKLSESRNKVMSMGGDATQIQNRITEILDEQMLAMEGVRLRGIEMSPEDRQYIIDSSNDQHQLREVIDTINNNKDIDQETKALMINNEAAKIQEIESERERIFSSYAPKARAARETQRAKDVIEDLGISDKFDVVSVQDEAEMAKSIEDSGYSAKESKDAAAISFGIFVPEPDSKTGKRKIILNETDIAKIDKWTTAQHETLHVVLSEVLKDATETDVLALGNAVREKLMEIDPKTLGDTDFARRFLEYRNDPADTQAEELLTLLSEAITTGDVKFNEGFFTKIQDLIRRMFQNAFPGSKFGKIKFDSAENVYKFIKDYNRSFEKGKATKAQKAAVKEGVEVERTGRMDFANKFLDVEFKNSKGEPVKLKLAKKLSPEKTTAVEQSILELKQEIKENEDIAKKFGKEPIPTAKQQRLEQSILKDQLKPTIDSFVESQTKRLFDPIAPDARNNVTRQAFRESMVSDIETMIVKEFEQKQDIEKFITSRGYLRANSLAKRLGIKSVEQGITKDIDQAKGVAAETETVTVEEKTPTKQIKLKERLGDDAIKITEEVKKRGKDIDLETVDFKTLKDLTPEMTQEMFGISPKPGNLSKADVRNAQQFISKNADVLIAMLPEGSTPSGTSTGVQKVLLDAFYTKGDRAVMAKTGSKAGLKEQTKRDNITKEEFNELFGITPAGQPNLSDRNTSSRIKALVTQTGRMLTNQAIREQAEAKGEKVPSKVFEGKSKLMFSKKAEQTVLDSAYENYISDQKFWSKFSREVGGKNYNFNDPQQLKEWKEKEFPKLVKIFPKDFIINSGAFYGAGKTIKTGPNKGKKTYQFPFRDENPTKVSKQEKLQPEHRRIFEEYLNKNFEDSDYGPPIKNLNTALKKISQKTKKFDSYFASQENLDNNRIKETVLKEIFTRIQNADGNIVPAAVGMLRTTAAEQAHFMRKLAPITFRQLGIENLASGQITEEHALGASLTAKQALLLASDKLVNDNFTGIQVNYFQGPISKANDQKVNRKELGMKEGPQKQDLYNVLMGVYDGWLRYAMVEDFNLNEIQIFKTQPQYSSRYNEKLTLTKLYNVNVDVNITPEIIKLQNELIVKQIRGEITKSEARKTIDKSLPLLKMKFLASKKNVKQLNKSKVVKTSNQAPNSEDIRQAEVLDKALNIARDPNAPVKKIRVFDFDDTLARTKSNVLYTMPDGTTGKLTAEEFAKKGDKMLAEGAVWDFSEFNKVMEGREGPLLGVAKLIQQARGTKDVFVLTARAAEAAPAIKEFLDSVGLNIPIENITGLGDSSPLAKSNWIVDKAADGYNDFYFADDHMGNVDAVQKALAVMEAKGKVQQAKIKFSLNTKRDLKWKQDRENDRTFISKFNIGDKKYEVTLTDASGRGNVEFAFARIVGKDRVFDMIGDGNASEVVSIVTNGIVDLVKSNRIPIKEIVFSADKPSRTRVYERIAKMWADQLGWNMERYEGYSETGSDFVISRQEWAQKLIDKKVDKRGFEMQASDPAPKDFESIEPFTLEEQAAVREVFESQQRYREVKFSKKSKPVQTVLDVIDVKSKVQQAKVKFSKNVDQMMNNIIYEKTGIEQYKEFSEIAAQARGRKKKSWNLIPPSAQDFGGLLYKLLAKGKQGDTQWEWMQEHLIKPYGRAMNDLSVAQNQLMADFRALKESLIGVPKNLKKEAFGGFTNEDVVRVATWDRQGIEIDGISKRDLEAVRKYVANKPDLNIFIDQLIAITKGDGYYYPGRNWLAGTITTDFREGLRKVTRKNLLEQWQANVDLAFNESTMNKLEAAFGPKYREALENSLERMSSGQNRRQGMSRIEQRFLDYINNSVGAVMFLNARSAVLQTISAVNFINWKDNNPMKAALAFANQKQYWSDFMKLMNSDFLVDRRNGLKINVSESEIAEAAKTSKNTVKGVITYLLNKGFAFTQIADSFAIATGGATLYRNRIKTYKKQGLSEAEATEKAFLDFRELAEESQQSARADKISQQQASTLGRLVLAFANTPSQYARIMDKAGRDLINNRGDWKANMSKIAYYGFVQNLLFTTLQSALFAYGMDDDEEEDMKVFPEDKMLDTANSMADNILKGMGVAGVVLAQSKNTIIDLIKRSQKDPYFNPDAEFFPGPNYEDAVMKLLAISPPVSIKFRKIKGGITDWYFNRWRPEASEPFNINNPSYRAGSKVIAGVSNVPLDRLFQKLENIQGALDDTNPLWQRVFMALGWPKWQLETEKEKEKRKAEEKKQKRNLRAKDKLSIYTKDEQVSILKQYKLTDEQIKRLKNEDLRVEKIKELRKKTKRIYVPK